MVSTTSMALLAHISKLFVFTHKAESCAPFRARIEVRSRGMETNKVIPFPAAAQTALPETTPRSSRILVHIGKQLIAIDVSCRAMVPRGSHGTTEKSAGNAAGRKRRNEHTR